MALGNARPATNLKLRGYVPEDFEVLFALDEACFEPQFRFSRHVLRQSLLAKNALTIIAEDRATIAGFCVAHTKGTPTAKSAYIVTLDVAEAYRRQGLAHSLMLRVERQCASLGCVHLLLHVFTGNYAAVRFYERCGYQRTALIPGFYGKDASDSSVNAWAYQKDLRQTEAPNT